MLGEVDTIYATTLPDPIVCGHEIVDSFVSTDVFLGGLYYSMSLCGTDPSFITVDGSLNDVYDTSGVFDRSDTDTVLWYKIIP
jgi:hypothetical protein